MHDIDLQLDQQRTYQPGRGRWLRWRAARERQITNIVNLKEDKSVSEHA